MNSNTTDPSYETLIPSSKDLILKEIEIVNADIKKFDDYSFIIKGWSITLWTGFIAWLIVNIEETLLSEITIYFPIIVLLAFWFLDGLMKYFQRIFIKRNEVLEDFINGEELKVEIKTVDNENSTNTETKEINSINKNLSPIVNKKKKEKKKKNEKIAFKFYNYDTTSRLTIKNIPETKRNKFKKSYFKKRKFYKCFFVRIVSTLYQLFIIFTLGIAQFFMTHFFFNWILITIFTVSIILCWRFSNLGWI